ncbi:hypothetical protein RHGRI_022261 [Rhododendron griersonianum]|uniref:CBS n=1 Tax=Rhododendron griersonianum TaxID=479676 RepID=A0AAV6J4G8_9ERIC|nr:hypothetical protein RHGRI_022261 [Rhododendron griersonianum]
MNSTNITGDQEKSKQHKIRDLKDRSEQPESRKCSPEVDEGRSWSTKSGTDDRCSTTSINEPDYNFSKAQEYRRDLGKFRHLPVVENGEVIALLDITKCLYDAISRMEKAAEQGSAIAAAVEGVERQWGSNFSGDSHLDKDEEIRSGIVNFYEGLFREEGVGRPRVDELEFDAISVEDASCLERPFDELEVVAALKSMNGDKASGQDAPSAFIETLRDRMFKPSLSTIVAENAKVAIVLPSDPVHVAAKKMQELRVNSVVIIATGTKILGILTSKDILMRVVAQNLSPELTLVEKVMTPNPECATLETTILEALHIMRDGKFLHLPVVDKDGYIAACVDVLQITHAAISMVESSSGAANDVANTMMQKFWDSALALEPPDDYDNQSEMSMSALNASDGTEHGKSSYPSLGLGNSFAFKFEDCKGRVHRLNFGTENLGELVATVMQRVGAVSDQEHPQLLYEDDEGDKVLLTTDGDLVGAVSHARSVGLKLLRLHLDFSDSSQQKTGPESCSTSTEKTGWLTLRSGIFAGAVALTGIGVLVYLKRSNL